MKYLLPIILCATLWSASAHAKDYPFKLADPDPKAEEAVKQLYDSGQLKSASEIPDTLVAIWLKASDDEPLYLFVSPHGVCEIASCWIVGFRPANGGWVKVYDQPVGEDIDVGVTPHEIDGHHDIVQMEEQGDKRIQKTSIWSGQGYGEPVSAESDIKNDDATGEEN